MHASAWYRSAESMADFGGNHRPVLNAARDTLPHVVFENAVKALLDAGSADRAGIWPAGELARVIDSGRVLERKPGPMPEQWKYADFSIPFLRDALNSRSPILSGSGFPESLPHFGPLVGMEKAVWLPIRSNSRVFGLAVVVYASAGAEIQLDRLSACAGEIAGALEIYRDRLRLELAEQEARCQIRISRGIVSRDPAQSLFSRIAHAARFYTGAEFVALRAAGPPLAFEAAGEASQKWFSWLESGLASICESVERNGCIVDLGGAELAGRLAGPVAASLEAVDRVVAIPIQVQDQTLAVLLAGLRPAADSGEICARLGQYVVLAALTLDRDRRTAETTQWADSWRRTIETSAECLLELDLAGHVREANHAARRFLRLHSGELAVGRIEDLFDLSAREAITEWREHAVRPGQCKTEVILEAGLLSGKVTRLRFRSEIPARDGSAGFLIHLEELDPGKDLVESGGGIAAILLALVGAIDSGVLLLDDLGNIRMVSDRFAQIMGTSSRRLFDLGTMDALVDHLSGQFNHPSETAARWRERPLPDGESLQAVLEMVRPSTKVIERLARPMIGSDGQRMGRMEVYRDITRERMVQSKLLQTEKMAALGLFVSGIAHELNNPLTSIQGYAQLLSTRTTLAERLADAQRIAQEAERAGRIVKNLLLFARETKPERSLVDLNEIVKRTLALRSYELGLENIRVEMDLDTDLPPTLGDAGQLQQAILNLLGNSEHAIRQERGRGCIAIVTRRLASSRILLEVTDDGPGIPPEAAARIFDPFFTTKPAGVGTGLGLSIVYGIVKEHGGEVAVESVSPRGTTVRIELMASIPDPRAIPAASTPIPKATTLPFLCPSGTPSRRERILVIEDEPTVAHLLADVLSGEGFHVDVLLDSRDGLERLRNTPYALAICDLKMPHVDGPEIFNELRRIGSPMQHRLLFVTGDTLSPHTLDFLHAAGMPYLAKPFLVEELKQIVRSALDSPPAEREMHLRSSRPGETGRRN